MPASEENLLDQILITEIDGDKKEHKECNHVNCRCKDNLQNLTKETALIRTKYASFIAQNKHNIQFYSKNQNIYLPDEKKKFNEYNQRKKEELYKTEMCRSLEEYGTCRYGDKCQFAHNEQELRIVLRHPKYRTEICKTFWMQGNCPYEKRCCFIHVGVTDDDILENRVMACEEVKSFLREKKIEKMSDENIKKELFKQNEEDIFFNQIQVTQNENKYMNEDIIEFGRWRDEFENVFEPKIFLVRKRKAEKDKRVVGGEFYCEPNKKQIDYILRKFDI